MNVDTTLTLPLQGRCAFVGGASKGIGRATAELLAQRGATVIVLARSEKTLEAVVGGLDRRAGQEHAYVVGDVSNPDSIFTWVKNRVNNISPIHIVVNNSGGPPGGLLVESPVAELQQAFQNHVLFSHQLMQILVPGMRKTGIGRFINIISTSVKQPIEGLGVSNTVRGAMASWAKTLATELGPDGITVNNVLPGATSTDRLEAIIQRRAAESGATANDVRAELTAEIPIGRFATPQEIAAAVAFLASDEAAYITGTSILVDGGRTRALS